MTAPPPSEKLAQPYKRGLARVFDGLIVIGIIVFLAGLNVFHRDIELALVFAIPILYELGFIALSGDTPGKRVMSVEVIRADGVEPPGWFTSAVRIGVPAATLIIPFGPLIVWMWLLFDPARQGVHDKLAKTYVVNA